MSVIFQSKNYKNELLIMWTMVKNTIKILNYDKIYTQSFFNKIEIK